MTICRREMIFFILHVLCFEGSNSCIKRFVREHANFSSDENLILVNALALTILYFTRRKIERSKN